MYLPFFLNICTVNVIKNDTKSIYYSIKLSQLQVCLVVLFYEEKKIYRQVYQKQSIEINELNKKACHTAGFQNEDKVTER